MKITYFLLIALLFVSCNTNKNTDQLSARQIFDKSIEAAGGQSLYSSTITFNMAELNYVFYRQKNISNFEVTRRTDSIFYKATYNNGSTAYYENEVLQEESSALRKFIEAKFEAVAHLMAIPQVFDQNATLINRIEDVSIDKTNYYVLHVTFRDVGDNPTDEFVLYVHPETFFIDFIAEKFYLTGNRLLFRKAINQRQIDDLLFSDYNVFYSNLNDGVSLLEFYTQYNSGVLKQRNDLIFENVKVETNNKTNYSEK